MKQLTEIIDAVRWSLRPKDVWWEARHNDALDRVKREVSGMLEERRLYHASVLKQANARIKELEEKLKQEEKK